MASHWSYLWMVVIAMVALSGWWLAVRPKSSYNGISGTMSVLIMLLAILMCVLAIGGQYNSPRAVPASHLASSG